MAKKIDGVEATDNKTSALSVRMFFRGLRRYPLLGLLTLILAGGAAAVIWFFLPLPKLTGYVVFQVHAQPPSVIAPAGDGRENFTYYRDAQAALVKSRLVLNSAISSELRNCEMLAKQEYPIDWLQDKLRVDFKASPEFMRLSLEGDDQKNLEAILTAVEKSYLADVVNKERTKLLAKYADLEKLEGEYGEKLTQIHKNIRKLTTELGAGDPTVAVLKEKYLQQQIGEAQRELIQLSFNLLRAQAESDVANAKIKGADGVPIPPEIIDDAVKLDPGYIQRTAKKKELAERLKKLKESLVEGAKPALLVDLEDQIAAAEKELREYSVKVRPDVEKQFRERSSTEARRIAGTRYDNIANLAELKKLILNQLDDLEKNIKKTRIAQVELHEFKTDIAHVERTYERISQEMAVIKPELKAPPRVSVLEEPTVVPGIEGNRRLKYSGLAGLGVLALGLGFITFLEVKNRRIVTSEEIANDLGLTVIGTVPALPRHTRSSETTSSDGNQMPAWQHVLTECVDTTRTLLVHSLDPSKTHRSIMIASAMPNEGKTMLACHLAASLARAGHNTLLVDGDMRRPSVHSVLGTEPLPGLCELLRGEAALTDALRKAVIPGLTVLAAGSWDRRVPQALSTNRWRLIKDQMESAFDYVIIDSPPLLLVADGLLMGQHVDGVVVSVLWNVSQMSSVGQARDRLSALGIPVLGVVINGLSLPAYGSGYDYYYPAATANGAPANADEIVANPS